MNRFSVVSLASTVAGAVIAFSPLAANAQTASNADFTPEQVRAQYVASGYQVDVPVTWWTPNHVTTFRVTDAASGRVVMVLVYPDTATADAERSAAEARDGSAAGVGPHLIAGYGYSTWRGNVALVESTADELAREYNAEQAADNQVMTSLPSPVEATSPAPTYAVEFDFINVIDEAAVNL